MKPDFFFDDFIPDARLELALSKHGRKLTSGLALVTRGVPRSLSLEHSSHHWALYILRYIFFLNLGVLRSDFQLSPESSVSAVLTQEPGQGLGAARSPSPEPGGAPCSPGAAAGAGAGAPPAPRSCQPRRAFPSPRVLRTPGAGVAAVPGVLCPSFCESKR